MPNVANTVDFCNFPLYLADRDRFPKFVHCDHINDLNWRLLHLRGASAVDLVIQIIFVQLDIFTKIVVCLKIIQVVLERMTIISFMTMFFMVF